MKNELLARCMSHGFIFDAPNANCLRFPVRGPMPAALIETWGAIWQCLPPAPLGRDYTVDVEVHPSDGDAADFYIAVTLRPPAS